MSITPTVSIKSGDFIPMDGKENPKLKLFFIAILIDRELNFCIPQFECLFPVRARLILFTQLIIEITSLLVVGSIFGLDGNGII